MSPGARAQAAIEILDAVIVAARDDGAAADTIVKRYFATRRYAGSKDRRAVRDLAYAAIRRAGDRPADGRAALVGLAREDDAVAALFDGSPHAPAPIASRERGAAAGDIPGWLADRLSGLGLTGRAPLDLRVNTLKTTRGALAIPGAVATPYASAGLRLADHVAVETLPGHDDGLFEVQDEGSQLVATACGARPGMTVIDLCAGAGGKTLALAADMANEGSLLACDTDRVRLSRLAPRAVRAGVGIVETMLLDPGHEAAGLAAMRLSADLVVIDAPCSGTGTWRRNPEARWRLTPDRLARVVATQARLLGIGAALVRPGGRLAYIVCSLLDEEGAGQAAAFLAANPGWRAEPVMLPTGEPRGPGLRLTPARDGTDGFFVATLIRA